MNSQAVLSYLESKRYGAYSREVLYDLGITKKAWEWSLRVLARNNSVCKVGKRGIYTRFCLPEHLERAEAAFRDDMERAHKRKDEMRRRAQRARYARKTVEPRPEIVRQWSHSNEWRPPKPIPTSVWDLGRLAA